MAIKVTVAKNSFTKFRSQHDPSSSSVTTDAPVDNGGTGSSFSPTDLLATSLLTCMLTIVDLLAKKLGLEELSSSGEVIKHMTSQPKRKVSKLEININLPDTLSPDEREQLENGAKNCPVALSLSQSIEQIVHFNYCASK